MRSPIPSPEGFVASNLADLNSETWVAKMKDSENLLSAICHL